MREQDLGTLFLRRAGSPVHPAWKQGLGRIDQGPFQATVTMSQPPCLPHHHRLFPASITSPPNQQILPTVRNFPSRRKSKRQSQILTNLEMYEHTAQTIIIIALNCPVSAMTAGWVRSLA